MVAERRGAVAWLRMNRPESLNAWDRSMGPAMVAAVPPVDVTWRLE